MWSQNQYETECGKFQLESDMWSNKAFDTACHMFESISHLWLFLTVNEADNLIG